MTRTVADAIAVPRHVTIAGLGNIGSAMADHVARMPEVRRLTLVDPDIYDQDNVAGQMIRRVDVGRPKVQAVRARLKLVDPDVEVDAIQRRIEDVPLGRLRADVLVGCLDSRGARRSLNQAARWLERPLIDTGVEPQWLLARVSVYGAGGQTPCHQCNWSDDDYDSLEQVVPCGGPAPETAPTAAPSALGGLAASIGSLEIARLLGGDAGDCACEVTIGAADHVHAFTSFTVNPQCRCDHRPLRAEPLEIGPLELTMRATLSLAGGDGRDARLFVDDRVFVQVLVCPRDGWERRLLRLEGRLRRGQRACRRCNTTLVPVGYHTLSALDHESLTGRQLDQPLATVGLERGDIVAIERDDTVHRFELGPIVRR